jgi:aspartate aminotransferase
VDKFARENQLTYKPEQIVVSTGAKQCLYNACFALLNPGDEAIIPAPYWVSYIDMVNLAGGTPVVINAPRAQHYKITAEQLAQAITPQTKLLFLNSPSNPTGMIYSHAELKAIGEVLLKHPHVIILSDDIYEHNYWAPEPFTNLPMLFPELYSRTIVINGVSKSYAMTGWRIGYAAGPVEIIKAMDKPINVA